MKKNGGKSHRSFLLFFYHLRVSLCGRLGFVFSEDIILFVLYIAWEILLLYVMIGIIVRILVSLEERTLEMGGIEVPSPASMSAVAMFIAL